MDQDGDLDIVDTTANYGGEDTRIYPRSLNNVKKYWIIFQKEWMQIKLQSLFKSHSRWSRTFGFCLIARLWTPQLKTTEPKNTSVLTTQSFISKKRNSE